MRRSLRMLGLLALIMVANALTISLMVSGVGPRAASLGGDGACIAGDVNGDSAADIGDAIYLLTYLFDNGPEPVACASPTASELEASLASFFPRALDRFELFIPWDLPADQWHTVLTVPPGRVLHITEASIGENDDTLVRINGVVYPFLFQRPAITAPSTDYMSLSENKALRVCLLPGDELSLLRPQSPLGGRIKGFWYDLADGESELGDALCQFFPRAEDFFFQEVLLQGDETTVVQTVPTGRAYLVTALLDGVGGARAFLRINDDPLTSIESGNVASSGDFEDGLNFPALARAFAGDTVTLTNDSPDLLNVRVFGYWLDATP